MLRFQRCGSRATGRGAGSGRIVRAESLRPKTDECTGRKATARRYIVGCACGHGQPPQPNVLTCRGVTLPPQSPPSHKLCARWSLPSPRPRAAAALSLGRRHVAWSQLSARQRSRASPERIRGDGARETPGASREGAGPAPPVGLRTRPVLWQRAHRPSRCPRGALAVPAAEAGSYNGILTSAWRDLPLLKRTLIFVTFGGCPRHGLQRRGTPCR